MKNEQYAGFWIRVLASIIDSAVVYVPMQLLQAMVYYLVLGVTYWEHQKMDLAAHSGEFGYVYQMPDEVFWWVTLVNITFGIFYFGSMTSSKWQGTVGKRALGLRVVDEEGNRISFKRSLIRYLGYIPSGLVLCLGYLWVGISERKQGWHDVIAKTVVLKDN